MTDHKRTEEKLSEPANAYIYAWTSVGDYENYPQYLNVSRLDGKITVTVRAPEYLPEMTPENMDDRWLKPGELACMALPDAEAAKLAEAIAEHLSQSEQQIR